LSPGFTFLPQFGPFTPCTGPGSGNYLVDANGVGSSFSGCPDQVPSVLYPGIGVRINCMRGVDLLGYGTSNLQTFMLVHVPGVPPAMQSCAGSSVTAGGFRPASAEDLRAALQERLAARRTRQ
jgi:hypothetical protein